MSNCWKMYIKPTKGTTDFGELHVGAALLSKAVFTAWVSMSRCLWRDCFWIVEGAKAVFMPKRHWLVPLLFFSVLRSHVGKRNAKRSHETTKKGADGESLLLEWSKVSSLSQFSFVKETNSGIYCSLTCSNVLRNDHGFCLWHHVKPLLNILTQMKTNVEISRIVNMKPNMCLRCQLTHNWTLSVTKCERQESRRRKRRRRRRRCGSNRKSLVRNEVVCVHVCTGVSVSPPLSLHHDLWGRQPVREQEAEETGEVWVCEGKRWVSSLAASWADQHPVLLLGSILCVSRFRKKNTLMYLN